MSGIVAICVYKAVNYYCTHISVGILCVFSVQGLKDFDHSAVRSAGSDDHVLTLCDIRIVGFLCMCR